MSPDSVVHEHLPAVHHWIEDGSYEDFRRNILESDLPLFIGLFDFSSTGYALMGTVTGRISSDFSNMVLREVNPCGEVALMGTYIMPPVPLAVEYFQNRAQVVVEKANRETIAMLLARPEVTHEP